MKCLLSPIKVNTDTRYVYASSRVRALEACMLNSHTMELMVQAKSPQECLKILAEVGTYDEYFMDIKSAHDYPVLLQHELTTTVALVKKFCHDDTILDVFLLEHDIHNLKVLLKQSFMNTLKEIPLEENQLKDILEPFGNIPIPILQKMVHKEPISVFDNYPYIKKLEDLTISLLDEVTQSLNLQKVDLVLDRFYYTSLSQFIESQNLPFAQRITEIVIDLLNITTFFRAHRFQLPLNEFKELLFDGGALGTRTLLKTYELDFETAAKQLQTTPYADVVKAAVAGLETDKTFTRLDIECRNMYMRFLRQAHYFPYNIEVLLAYLLAKKDEAEKIRTIFIGKFSNFSEEDIRKRLSETYI